MAELARITVYPIKSLDGADVAEAVVLPGGAVEDDRRFAIVDAGGRYVNGKRTDRVHAIRSSYDPAARRVTVGPRGGGAPGGRSFRLDDAGERGGLHAWLSAWFGLPVTLVEAPGTGFPDDTDAPGPTVIAAATLGAVSGWFGGWQEDDGRARFRANLEVGGVEPFWDDRLYAGAGRPVRFRVGGVVFEGVNPCQRCAVPGRSPETGRPTPAFAVRFAAKRQEALPAWAEASRFDHFYRLAVNTRLHDRGAGVIRVGDRVEILPAANQVGTASV